MTAKRTQQDTRYAEAAAEFGPAIARLARGYEADEDLRGDLVQAIHTALWQSFAYFEAQCSVRSWVYRIAHNVAISHVQSSRRRRPERLSGLDEIETLAAPGDLEASVAGKRLRESLLATIHRLKPADRQVMLLYLEDLSAAEIGDVTGLSARAVATRIHRVKALLARAYRTTGHQPNSEAETR